MLIDFENFVFRARALILLVLAVVTVIAIYFAS